ncbi:C40 family peptidase [Deinococcus radiotolerans]|uniref:Peptidase n=1 Tax=Deinococcus radiotolerans TaxID=1309407 RepID=A0ABQ2FK85_9DEIO|nr:C40 family peptidase [Deinococcus radiotolerans]GGK97821.1 peptidase [Deinococcus radiotolerans]
MPEARFLPAFLLLGALLVGGAHAQAVFTEPSSSGPAAAADGPSSVTVQPGDTAFSLARRAGLSVADLLALNHLSSADLKVGQVLTLRVVPTTYQVQPGDTLYALARRFNVTVEALLTASTLPTGTVLKVGQMLTLPPGAALPAGPSAGAAVLSTPALTAAPVPTGRVDSPFQPLNPAQQLPSLQPGRPMPAPHPGGPQGVTAPATPLPDWRNAALNLLNTPYVLGGVTRSGTDCSGLVLQVFTPLGVNLPRTSAEQARAGQPVETDALEPGDLVFFDTEGSGKVSHVGIYLGDDQFISANSYQGRVTVDRLHADRYWAPRYVGARRVLTPVTAFAPGH